MFLYVCAAGSSAGVCLDNWSWLHNRLRAGQLACRLPRLVQKASANETIASPWPSAPADENLLSLLWFSAVVVVAVVAATVVACCGGTRIAAWFDATRAATWALSGFLSAAFLTGSFFILRTIFEAGTIAAIFVALVNALLPLVIRTLTLTFGQSVGRSIGRSVGRSVAVGWSVGRSEGRLVGWLVGRPAVRPVYWLVRSWVVGLDGCGSLVNRSVGRSVSRSGSRSIYLLCAVSWANGWSVGRWVGRCDLSFSRP